MEEVTLCEAVSLKVFTQSADFLSFDSGLPISGGKNWALLLDIRCPVLSFWFYFCAYFCVRRYTVYIGIFPTFTIWKIWTPQQKEFSLCFLSLHLHPPPPNNMLLWTYISSPYGFPCQCIYVCFPTVGEVAALGVGWSCQPVDQAAFLRWQKHASCTESQCLLQLIPQASALTGNRVLWKFTVADEVQKITSKTNS